MVIAPGGPDTGQWSGAYRHQMLVQCHRWQTLVNHLWAPDSGWCKVCQLPIFGRFTISPPDIGYCDLGTQQSLEGHSPLGVQPHLKMRNPWRTNTGPPQPGLIGAPYYHPHTMCPWARVLPVGVSAYLQTPCSSLIPLIKGVQRTPMGLP